MFKSICHSECIDGFGKLLLEVGKEYNISKDVQVDNNNLPKYYIYSGSKLILTLRHGANFLGDFEKYLYSQQEMRDRKLNEILKDVTT